MEEVSSVYVPDDNEMFFTGKMVNLKKMVFPFSFNQSIGYSGPVFFDHQVKKGEKEE